MVQCQQTRRWLGEEALVDEAVWSCHVCPERELYVRLSQDRLLDVVNDAIERARRHFGLPDDGAETVVWLGNQPEIVFEEALGVYHLYLARNSTWLQFLFQAGHEAYHRVCSTRLNFVTWPDEMMAVRFSLQYLRFVGEDGHADASERWLKAQEARRPTPRADLETSFAETLAADAPAVYGAVFALGRELEEAVSPEAMDSLVTHYDASGDIDFAPWLADLAPEVAERAAATSAAKTRSEASIRLVAARAASALTRAPAAYSRPRAAVRTSPGRALNRAPRGYWKLSH